MNCAELTGLCGRLHVSKFPTFMTFKESGRVEVFYGKLVEIGHLSVSFFVHCCVGCFVQVVAVSPIKCTPLTLLHHPPTAC